MNTSEIDPQFPAARWYERNNAAFLAWSWSYTAKRIVLSYWITRNHFR